MNIIFAIILKLCLVLSLMAGCASESPPSANTIAPPAGRIDSPNGNLSITRGEQVFFSGTGTDPGGLALAYRWNFGGSGTSDVTLKDPGDVQFDNPGTHTVTFTVTNSAGLSGTDTRTITVLSNPPSGQIVMPAADITISAGEAVFFRGSGTDADGLELAYHWDFGDSGIADASVEGPVNAQFNNPGLHTVTFTVTNSAGLSDSDTRTVTVQDIGATGLISQQPWRLLYVDSQEVNAEDGRGINAFDGNPNTFWHTEWSNGQPSHPHEIQIDLGATYQLERFHYLPRQGVSSTGRIQDFQLYVSYNAGDWGNPVISGSFPDAVDEQTVVLSTMPIGRYIRLVALSEVNGQPFTTLAEINFTGRPFHGNLPPRGVINAPTENLMVMTGASVSFSGTGTDPDNNLPLTYHWNFGDPNIVDIYSADPGDVQFNHPGTYTVTFTVIDAHSRADLFPPTMIIKVVGFLGDTLIPQTDWSLKYTNSEELTGMNGRAENAFDGNPNTIWHTEFSNGQSAHPHEIQIDLGTALTLDTMHYLPRQNVSNGRIKDYAIYVSGNGADWQFPVAMGSFANTATQKTVLFAPKTGRFIRLVSLSEVAGRPDASAAEINAEGVCRTPYVKLARPLTMHVQKSRDLAVIGAVCLNPDDYPGWGVNYVLSDGSGIIDEVTLFDAPYEHTFAGLNLVEHSVDAYIVDENGEPVMGVDTVDWAVQVGIGDYYVAIGDSITAGLGDDVASDNQSQDGRNINGGFTPILNDRLTTGRGYPHSVVNEGINGIISAGGLQKLPDVINRHPDGQYYLILYGTNDSAATPPVPSGRDLNPGDAGYNGSFKDNLQRMIDIIVAAGKSPYLAKVPYTLSGEARNNRIQDYNVAIDQLVAKNQIGVVPPDFFSHFEANPGQLSDEVHPNGVGYQSMANLWRIRLMQ